MNRWSIGEVTVMDVAFGRSKLFLEIACVRISLWTMWRRKPGTGPIVSTRRLQQLAGLRPAPPLQTVRRVPADDRQQMHAFGREGVVDTLGAITVQERLAEKAAVSGVVIGPLEIVDAVADADADGIGEPRVGRKNAEYSGSRLTRDWTLKIRRAVPACLDVLQRIRGVARASGRSSRNVRLRRSCRR